MRNLYWLLLSHYQYRYWTCCVYCDLLLKSSRCKTRNGFPLSLDSVFPPTTTTISWGPMPLTLAVPPFYVLVTRTSIIYLTHTAEDLSKRFVTNRIDRRFFCLPMHYFCNIFSRQVVITKKWLHRWDVKKQATNVHSAFRGWTNVNKISSHRI